MVSAVSSSARSTFHRAILLVLLAGYAYSLPPYMYAIMQPEEYFPVHELLLNETLPVESASPAEATHKETTGPVNATTAGANATKQLRLPEFLTSPTGHRVVEFYAPWCPHCRHFKDQFIQFARQITSLATHSGSHVDVHAVSCQVHHPVCQHSSVNGFPWIVVIPDGSLNGTRVKHHDLHPFMVLDMLGIQFDEIGAASELDTVESSQSVLRQAKGSHDGADHGHVARTKDDIYMDAFLSFDMALRQSVFMKPGPLAIMRRRTFTEWINLLHDTLPPAWRIHRQLNSIRDHMDDAIKDEAKLLALIDPHKPQKEEWSISCSHGEEGMGYTCGLWNLFMIMSIGIVEWNKMANEWSTVPTMRAADTLRLYVEHFFGCEVCSHNFVKAYDSCSFDRCDRLTRKVGKLADWKELPLWLWETHNAVNVRLMKERAVREGRRTTLQDEADAQWPSRADCPRCWLPDGSWNEEFIYMYLRLTYWPDDESSEKTRSYLSTTKSLLEGDDDYYFAQDRSSAATIALPFLTIGGTAAVAAYIAHAKKMQRELSGHHKKFESDVAV